MNEKQHLFSIVSGFTLRPHEAVCPVPIMHIFYCLYGPDERVEWLKRFSRKELDIRLHVKEYQQVEMALVDAYNYQREHYFSLSE